MVGQMRTSFVEFTQRCSGETIALACPARNLREELCASFSLGRSFPRPKAHPYGLSENEAKPTAELGSHDAVVGARLGFVTSAK
jgi:hypothetical protein